MLINFTSYYVDCRDLILNFPQRVFSAPSTLIELLTRKSIYKLGRKKKLEKRLSNKWICVMEAQKEYVRK